MNPTINTHILRELGPRFARFIADALPGDPLLGSVAALKIPLPQLKAWSRAKLLTRGYDEHNNTTYLCTVRVTDNGRVMRGVPVEGALAE